MLDWLTGEQHRASVVAIDGLPRVHASQEGNVLFSPRLPVLGFEQFRDRSMSVGGALLVALVLRSEVARCGLRR